MGENARQLNKYRIISGYCVIHTYVLRTDCKHARFINWSAGLQSGWPAFDKYVEVIPF